MMTLGGGKVFEQIKEDFEATGYKVYPHLLDARDYGVPQLRSRVILLGVRIDLDFVFEAPAKTHGEGLKPYVTLRDAIKDLEYIVDMVYTGGYSSMFMTRNRKKSWEEQSFTIQASARQAPMHPGGAPMVKVDKERWEFSNGGDNERRLSIKEAARIQTFPDWHEFNSGNDNVSHNTKVDKVFKQIGNAVPVKMAKAIIRPIADYLYSTLEYSLASVIEFDEVDVTFVQTNEQISAIEQQPYQMSLFDPL